MSSTNSSSSDTESSERRYAEVPGMGKPWHPRKPALFPSLKRGQRGQGSGKVTGAETPNPSFLHQEVHLCNESN